MPYETLLLAIDQAVATVTLNRPKVLNALNTQALDELEAVFTALATDPAVHVILLTGAGEKAFVAGADIAELAATDALTGEQKARRGQHVFGLIASCGKPVIALVNGFALGGGCELALACTLRVASETAKFGQPEVKLGIIPGYGGTQRLPRLVGPAAALKLILTGAIIDAAEAHRIGLADEVVPLDELLARGHELARAMIAVAPLALTACLQAVQQGTGLSLEAGLDLEARLFGPLCATEDKAEGTAAFLAKRSPIWKSVAKT